MMRFSLISTFFFLRYPSLPTQRTLTLNDWAVSADTHEQQRKEMENEKKEGKRRRR